MSFDPKSDPEFEKIVQAIEIESIAPIHAAADLKGRLKQDTRVFRFQIKIGAISLDIPIYEDASDDPEKDRELAVKAFKTLLAALAEKSLALY